MIDTTILLSIILIAPFLIKIVALRIWPEFEMGVWVNIIFTVMFVIGLTILIGYIYNQQTATTATRVVRFAN